MEPKSFNKLPWKKDLFEKLCGSFQIPKEEVIRMENIHIQYADKVILDRINWTIQSGDRWLLKGKNGSGKSTLISLLIGENPQAYAQKFWLFGTKRGSGESIWDVKRPVGFVAPELVRFFPSNQTVFKVIASGFFDTMGLFKKINSEQESKILSWAELFELETFLTTPIHRIPLEKQRWALLARALVKTPKLLILDEASQGMDERQRQIFKLTVGEIVKNTGITLIYVSHYQEDIPDSVNQIFSLD